MNFVDGDGPGASAERPSGCQGSVAFKTPAIVGMTSMLCTLRSLTTGSCWPGSLTKRGTAMMSASVSRSTPLNGRPGRKLTP